LITAIYATLSIAFLLYPFFLLFDLTLDADKLGAGFAFVFLLGMWVLLGVALMLSKIRGEIPLWSALIALPLMLLSLILVTMSAYDLPDLSAAGNSVRWMVGVHALVPLILFLYVGWASIPRAHGLLSANRASAIAWSAVFVLTMLTTITWPKAKAVADQRQKKIVLDRRTRFEAIPSDAPVEQWMPFLEINTSELHNEAAQRIRDLPDRQAQLERIFKGPSFRYCFFTHIYQFDLSPSPSLCEFIRRWLKEQSIALKPTEEQRRYRDLKPGGYTDDTPMIACVPTLRWFASNKCPMFEELNAFEATLLSYPGGRENDEPLFSALDEIKRTLQR